MILYAIQSVIVLGITLSIYKLTLKTEKSFMFNRLYLLATLLLCLITPILQIETSHTIPVISELNFPSLASFNEVSNEVIKMETIQELERESKYNLSQFLYYSITLVLLFRFLNNLVRIMLRTLNIGKTIKGFKIVYVSGEVSLSSFFNYLFVSKSHYDKKIEQEFIQHELAHSQQLHSIDILVVELLTCFFWFNPFIWLYKKEILENHEYLADQYVVESGVEVEYYTHKIIQSGNRNHPFNLLSGFSFIQTKNRLVMLHKKESTVVKRAIKLSIVMLLSLGIFTISSFDYSESKEPFVVVLDAGHGGHDPGNKVGEISEKQLILVICNKLKSLSNNKKVKIVLTRANDEFLELNDRVKISNGHKADFFLSLHLNSINKEKYGDHSGIEAYYDENGKFSEESLKYSEILVSDHLETICEKGKIKTAGFIVLKNNTQSPAVLLELGFLTNETDRKRLNDPEHQDKIAETIYNSLIQIKNLK